MHKKLALILLSLMFFSEKQQTAFRCSSIFLKNKISLFAKKFLEVENQKPVIENIQILSFLPIEEELKMKLYEMQQKKGAFIKMILSSSVYKNQNEMVDQIKKNHSVVACLPSVYDDVDWHLESDELKNKIECKLFHKKEFKSTIQVALFTAESLEQNLMVSKEVMIDNESEQCLLMVKDNKIISLFENSFEQILQEYKK